MVADKIVVKGAKVHNLKEVDVDIPRNTLTVITGLSGSGKSSLAFDTIFAEGQRRYVESLSTYARQFLQLMEKPDVESIDGLSPAISIDQKTSSRSPRSTVGTVTEIYDYLRLLFAKIGVPHCPNCGDPVTRQAASQIIDKIADYPEGKKIVIMAPVVKDRKGSHVRAFEKIKKDGFVRVRVDGDILSMLEIPELEEDRKHSIDIVVDRLVVKNFKKEIKKLSSGQEIDVPNPDRTRLADSIETALKFGNGVMIVQDHEDKSEEIFSEKFACMKCDISLPDVEPRHFSFNSPHGACEACHGLGTRLEMDPNLIIPNKNLSIAEGAILPWSATTSKLNWYNRILHSVADANGFSVNKAVKDLTEKEMNIVLYGTGDKKYKVKIDKNGEQSYGFSGEYMTSFEGIIPNLERRYRETESDYVRKKLESYMRILPCPECGGARLRKEVLSVRIDGRNIVDVTDMSISGALNFFKSLNLSDTDKQVAKLILDEVHNRLGFLINVGIPYLTLSRSANTLSGGEAQRIRLATQIGSKLQGVLYVLDEPSIGLHQNDNAKLIKTLTRLRDIGNTVLVVEHDTDMMLAADYILDVGPGAGRHGGKIVAMGTPEEIMKNDKSVTGQYLSGKKKISIPKKRRKGNGKKISIKGAAQHNLQDVSVDVPLGTFIGVTGVSGSGKSTLINEILVRKIANKLYKSKAIPGEHKEILGIEHIDKIINIDQAPIGRTPRSNPATYTGVFTDIRDLFASTPEARTRGYKAGRFSFNVKGGRCEACRGDGIKKIEMHFLPDIYVPCEVCKGKRYNQEALEITYRGKNIADILEMTVNEGFEFFDAIPTVKNKLKTLVEVGLGYIRLGQSATTLSGGEAQRVKLATELTKRSTGKTFYVLDEPTTGLHFDDVKKLLEVLNKLVDGGNTVLTIEHNLDVIKCADHIIDMGPEGGDKGGLVVAEGTPEKVTQIKESYTGQWLKTVGVK